MVLLILVMCLDKKSVANSILLPSTTKSKTDALCKQSRLNSILVPWSRSYISQGHLKAASKRHTERIRMDDPTISRITVENEADWLRVQDNFTKALRDSMEARLTSLPGGKDGPAAKAVRKELEQRVKKVSRLSQPMDGDACS